MEPNTKRKTLKEHSQDRLDNKKRYNRSIVQAMSDEELRQIHNMIVEEAEMRDADDLTTSTNRNILKVE